MSTQTKQSLMGEMTPASAPPAPRPTSMLLDPELFNHAIRVGRLLAISPLFPEHLRRAGGDAAMANAVLVMNMAHRLGEDPLAVAQNIYFVGGKPGWSASYMIARANLAGVFKGRIRWRIAGKAETLTVTAYAALADTGEEASATADMVMARAEGWTSNKKYQSMPEQMLHWRSATMLIRRYCPEVMLGISTADELEDVIDVQPAPRRPRVSDAAPKAKAEAAPVEDAVIVEEAPAPETQESREEANPSAMAEEIELGFEDAATEADVEKILATYAEEIAALPEALAAQVRTAERSRRAQILAAMLTAEFQGALDKEALAEMERETYARRIARLRDLSPAAADQLGEVIQARRAEL